MWPFSYVFFEMTIVWVEPRARHAHFRLRYDILVHGGPISDLRGKPHALIQTEVAHPMYGFDRWSIRIGELGM